MSDQRRDLECGMVVNEDLTLTADLGPCDGHGLVIEGSGITVDLNGHSIIGDPNLRTGRDKAGILLRQAQGVTVKSGTVSGFDAGVAIMGGGGNTVRDITAEDNVNYRVITGRNVDADDVDGEEGLCLFGDGIVVSNSSENVIERNRVFGNGPLSGIALVGDANDNRVADNDIRDNDVLNQAPDGRPTTCGTGPNQGPMTRGRPVQAIGIRVEGPGADRNVIDGNRVTRSALAGIAVHGRNISAGAPSNEDTVIRNNLVYETGRTTHQMDPHAHGIALLRQGPAVVRPPDNVTIEGNVSSRNFGHGIYLAGRESRGHTVAGNQADRNQGMGIFLEGPGSDGLGGVMQTTVRANRATGNRIDGVDGNEDCDRNTWSGNRFGTVNQPCVASEGTGTVIGAPAPPQLLRRGPITS